MSTIRYASCREYVSEGSKDPTVYNPYNHIYKGDVYEFLWFKYARNVRHITISEELTLKIIHALEHKRYKDFVDALNAYRTTTPDKYILDYLHWSEYLYHREIISNIGNGESRDVILKQFMDYLIPGPLYKVVSTHNKAMHGGSFTYELNMPTPTISDGEICKRGYHLTSNPSLWANRACRIYRAIGDDLFEVDGDKSCFGSVTLTSELECPYIIRLDNIVGRCQMHILDAIALIEMEYGLRDIEYNISAKVANEYLTEFNLCRDVKYWLASIIHRNGNYND